MVQPGIGVSCRRVGLDTTDSCTDTGCRNGVRPERPEVRCAGGARGYWRRGAAIESGRNGRKHECARVTVSADMRPAMGSGRDGRKHGADLYHVFEVLDPAMESGRKHVWWTFLVHHGRLSSMESGRDDRKHGSRILAGLTCRYGLLRAVGRLVSDTPGNTLGVSTESACDLYASGASVSRCHLTARKNGSAVELSMSTGGRADLSMRDIVEAARSGGSVANVPARDAAATRSAAAPRTGW